MRRPELMHEEPASERESRMARTKREYGSGCLLETRKGWAIRWRELEIAPDGKKRRVLRYKTLGVMSRKEAAMLLARQVIKVGSQ